MQPVALVLRHRFPGKYAFNVLAGALETDPVTRGLPVDFAPDREAMLEAIRRHSDEGRQVVAAWSFYSPSFGEAAEDLLWLKERLGGRSALCIAGGVHATAEPEQVLRAGFDAVAVGEGEGTLVELLVRLSRGDRALDTQGLARLEGDRLVSTGRGVAIDLDQYPPFSVLHRRFGAIELTRGCIYACGFCQTPFMNRARFRHRSVASVARWARAMREAGLRHFRFITPTALSYGSSDESVQLERVEELLSSVRQAIGPEARLYFGTFPSELRPEHVSAEALAILRRFVDNDNLIIGAQSGSERLLSATHRGHGAEVVVRAVRLALEAGFLPNVDFILGLPGERPEELAATLALMRAVSELGARVHGHAFMPLPGTPLRDAPPGVVDERTRGELERLSSRGRLYGQWKRQVEIARALARGRREARGPAT